jgi:hypothetical protein
LLVPSLHKQPIAIVPKLRHRQSFTSS